MSVRVGRKVGRYYISRGKSGTRVSTKIMGYNVSRFIPAKKTKSKPKEDYDDIPFFQTEEESRAQNRMFLWLAFVLCSFFFTVWLTHQILTPLWVFFIIQAIGTYFIHRNVDTSGKILGLFFPIVILIYPLAWVFWIIVFIIAGLLV